MTEDEAKAWLEKKMDVSRETFAKLEVYIALIGDEMQRQNLIAPSTFPQIWARHIVDSAQLLLHADRERGDGVWLDLGSGAGLPGLVIALLSERRVLLTESRKLRSAFLARCIEELGLADRVQVHEGKVEQIEDLRADAISARAFAPLPKLLRVAQRFSHKNTRWLLPKGQNAAAEYEEARHDWIMFMQVKKSATDSESGILVGTVRGPRT